MEERKVLSREDIVRADDSSYNEVFVKEWGGYVRVYVISAKDRLEFEGKYTKKESGSINFEHKEAPLDLLSCSLRSANGMPLFSKEDLNMLGDKNGKVVNLLFNEALKLNWMTQESQEQVKKN